MSLIVNQKLLQDDPDSPTGLPEGVMEASGDAPVFPPEGWVELFRVNGRAYLVKKHISPKVVFRYMRALRKRGDDGAAMAAMLYDVLGEAVVDALADEDLSDEEYATVMKVVEKHTMAASRGVMGKS